MTSISRSGLFELLDITGQDAEACSALLDTPPDSAVQRAVDAMQTRLGTFTSHGIPAEGERQEVGIEALLRFAPTVHAYHAELGISPGISAASLGDVGLQLRINRTVHGRFGLDTWSWLTLHMVGNLFRLGRLQFHLVTSDGTLGRPEQPEWTLGVHIPEGGSLSPALVDESFAEARQFFGHHFPDKHVHTATCDSWMLDPYLVARLPGSNIASFAQRFVVDRCSDAPTDAVYFTFRQRGLENLAALPRDTTLQRVVLERIDDGGTWQLGHGHLEL